MAFDVVPFTRPRDDDSFWTDDDAKQLKILQNLIAQQTKYENASPDEPKVQPPNQPATLLGRGILDIILRLPRCVGSIAMSTIEFIKNKFVSFWQSRHNQDDADGVRDLGTWV
ncbi:uncharacterized protein LOC133205212 [Saccostrea echinata]|uniref:uncharacterized protein LOC133205212 n=1 Tax=Saccostrea echinata TaxID=191078 RepID=UPI002A83E24F|nr:uncharacterized protein LOC133205212 [Saccostrea echinata]